MGINAVIVKLNISVTYTPPGESLEVDAEMYNILRQTLCNCETLILEDINLPHIDWKLFSGNEEKSYGMLDFLETTTIYVIWLQNQHDKNFTLHLITGTQDSIVSNFAMGSQFLPS